MGAENSWAADTVSLGGRKDTEETRSTEPRRQIAPKPQSTMTTSRMVTTCVAVVAMVITLAAIFGGGSGTPKKPIRNAADPALQVAVKRPVRMSPHKPNRAAFAHRSGRENGKLAAKREPTARAASHKFDEPEPIAEPAPAPEPVPEAEPAPPASPAPTPPAVEFGL